MVMIMADFEGNLKFAILHHIHSVSTISIDAVHHERKYKEFNSVDIKTIKVLY
jgi:hypothetical protein